MNFGHILDIAVRPKWVHAQWLAYPCPPQGCPHTLHHWGTAQQDPGKRSGQPLKIQRSYHHLIWEEKWVCCVIVLCFLLVVTVVMTSKWMSITGQPTITLLDEQPGLVDKTGERTDMTQMFVELQQIMEDSLKSSIYKLCKYASWSCAKHNSWHLWVKYPIDRAQWLDYLLSWAL